MVWKEDPPDHHLLDCCWWLRKKQWMRNPILFPLDRWEDGVFPDQFRTYLYSSIDLPPEKSERYIRIPCMDGDKKLIPWAPNEITRRPDCKPVTKKAWSYVDGHALWYSKEETDKHGNHKGGGRPCLKEPGDDPWASESDLFDENFDYNPKWNEDYCEGEWLSLIHI